MVLKSDRKIFEIAKETEHVTFQTTIRKTQSGYDLPMIVAGRGQGQIKQGRFIQAKSGTLNSNLWLTLANLMGLEIKSYADSHGVMSDLWT